MEILTLGNDTLRQKAVPILDMNGETKAFALEMIEAMRAGKGIGLAAPQVGVLSRVFVVQIDGDVPRVFINPAIIATSPEIAEYEEGCLSIPGMYADVVRPALITVQAWNERGRPFTLDAEGILARVIQHEYDHLEGTLFIDRLSEFKRNRIVALYEKKKRA
jgi:peptide deformylase